MVSAAPVSVRALVSRTELRPLGVGARLLQGASRLLRAQLPALPACPAPWPWALGAPGIRSGHVFPLRL